MERERSSEGQRWSVLWRESGHVTEVVSLKEGEWSCYGSGQFKGGRMVMLRRHFNGGRKVIRGSEVVSLMEGE